MESLNSPLRAHQLVEEGARWRVCLLGGFDLYGGGEHLTRLPSRAVTALLARLALWPQRAHAREELVELLWPGVDLATGRNRLRQALSALKSVLEPPGLLNRPVLMADRHSVRVVPGSLACDARDFERVARERRLDESRALYRGELLPGHYDDWIVDERAQLAALFERCGGDHDRAAAPAAPRAQPGPAPRIASSTPTLPDLGKVSIPNYLTRLFGADEQAAKLTSGVLGHRLVTLIGPGGGGKTRLAVEVANVLRTGSAPQHADRPGSAFDFVAFVPLVGSRSAEELIDALATACQVRVGVGAIIDRIEQALADRRVLLVLDNFEQLDDAAAAVVERLAAASPRLHQLVTSRRLLGLDGERAFRVAALALPSPAAGLEEAAASPAVALFIDRARAVRSDFHLGRGNVAPICELVRSLEGMPLAIELAASRVRSFAPAEMLERLRGAAVGRPSSASALDLLVRTGPRGSTDPRHASMQAVIAWSWQQLDEGRRGLLAALTVFVGSASLAAAEAVCSEDGDDVRLGIDELLAHSLLQLHEDDVADADAAPRLRLAEPLREFAAAHLDRARAKVLRARHRQWWMRWADDFGPTPPLRRVREELGNILAALASAVADGSPEDAVRVALALRAAFNEILLPAAGRAHLAAALEQVHDPELRSRGHGFLAGMCFEAGEGAEALRHAERGLADAGDDPAIRARALHTLASVRWRSLRDHKGLASMLDEAQALAARAGDVAVDASCDALRAFIVNVVERDYPRGEALHRLALDKWQRLGNLHAINGGAYNLAICALNGRRWGEALQRLDAVCRTAQDNEDWEQLGDALNVLGNTHARQRDWPAARVAFQECVRVSWAAMETHALAYGLWNLPQTLAHLRRPVAAARLMSFAAYFWERRFGPLDRSDRIHLRRVRRLVAVQLGAAGCDARWAEGAAMSLAEAVGLALAETSPDLAHRR